LDDLRWNNHHYTGLRGYGSAKTAQILSMFKFKEYFEGSSTTINAMHPGNVKTNLGEITVLFTGFTSIHSSIPTHGIL
jgi:retinol dehydrogenase 13